MSPDAHEPVPAEPVKEGEDPKHPAVEGPESGLPHGDTKDVTALEEALAAAQEEAAQNLDRARRTLADFDNYRKRARTEADAAAEKAKADVLLELVGVVDNFDRALVAIENVDEGVRLIHKQLVAVLEKSGVTVIVSDGAPFDPTVHEALMRRPADGAAPGTVVETFEKGYRLGDRVLRAAKVAVAEDA